jgi:adenosylcobinamide-phosphate synthase
MLLTFTIPETVSIILAALLLDWLFGDPRWMPHPVIWIGRLITWSERFWRRSVSSEKLAGLFLLLSTMLITAVSATLLIVLVRMLHPLVGYLVTVWLCWCCLAARSLADQSARVAAALAAGDLPGARKWLSYIVGRDTSELDQDGIWRATVETVAENSSDGIIAPLFYLMIGGPVAAITYKAVNTLDSMVGYKNDRYLLFGRASARFDDLMNYLPARLTGWLMLLVAPLVRLSWRGGLRIMLRDGRNHSSPNAGIPEAAAAGALGVQLGGTSRYAGVPVLKPFIGDPLQPLSARSYRGVIRLMYGSELLLVAGWLLVMLLIYFKG